MATAATVIQQALFTGSAHRIDCIVTDPDTSTGRANITGQVITLLIADPGGTTYSYTATHDDEDEGECHFVLTAGNHAATGSASAQVHIDGIPKGEFTFTFRAKLTT